MLEVKADGEPLLERKHRLARACTARTSARLAPLAPSIERSTSRNSRACANSGGGNGNGNGSGDDVIVNGNNNNNSNSDDRNFVTVLTSPPSPAQRQRWLVRNMWEFASVLNFFHVFRPVLNLGVEFAAEELELSLITPNNLLSDIHIPMLKVAICLSIPQVLASHKSHALTNWCFYKLMAEMS